MNTPTTELKRCAREKLNGNYGNSILVLLAYYLIPSAILGLFDLTLSSRSLPASSALGIESLLPAPTGLGGIIYYLANFLIAMISVILSCGMIRFHLELSRGREAQFTQLFSGFTQNPQRIIGAYLAMCILELLPILPGLLLLVLAETMLSSSRPMLGLAIILIIAGFLWAIRIALQYSLVFYLFMDDPEKRVGELLKESKQLMDGNRLRLLYLSLSFFGWSCLGFLSLGIGMLWIMPYYYQTLSWFYLDVTLR